MQTQQSTESRSYLVIKEFVLAAAVTLMFPPQPRSEIQENVKHLIGGFKWHKYNKEPQRLNDFVEIVLLASAKYPSVTPEMLVVTAHHESTFRQHVVSSTGARSTFQLAPSIARHVRAEIEPRCTLRTLEGSAYCAAAWLQHCMDKCGTPQKAFTLYVQGKTCKARSKRARNEARERADLMKRLEARNKEARYARI